MQIGPSGGGGIMLEDTFLQPFLRGGGGLLLKEVTKPSFWTAFTLDDASALCLQRLPRILHSSVPDLPLNLSSALCKEKKKRHTHFKQPCLYSKSGYIELFVLILNFYHLPGAECADYAATCQPLVFVYWQGFA